MKTKLPLWAKEAIRNCALVFGLLNVGFIINIFTHSPYITVCATCVIIIGALTWGANKFPKY